MVFESMKWFTGLAKEIHLLTALFENIEEIAPLLFTDHWLSTILYSSWLPVSKKKKKKPVNWNCIVNTYNLIDFRIFSR